MKLEIQSVPVLLINNGIAFKTGINNYILIRKRKMKKNIGTFDKVIRILVAVAIAILFYTNVINGLLGIVLIVLGIIFVITSLFSFCPLYLPVGINTGKKG